MKRTVIILLIIAGLGGLGFVSWRQGWVDQLLGRKTVEPVAGGKRTYPSTYPQGSEIITLGRLEPAGGVIDLLGPLGERLEKLAVKEGDTVEAGKEIGHFESRKMRELEVELNETQIAEAESRLSAETKTASKKLEAAKLAEEGQGGIDELDLASQRQQIEFLNVHRQQAQADLERIERLAKLPTELVSKQEVEHQALALKKAQEEITAAEAALARLTKGSQLKQKTAAADRAAAEAGVEQAREGVPIKSLKKQLALSQERLKQSTLLAPASGTVLKIFTPEGTHVTQRPILQLAELSRMVCIAEVPDNQIRQIRGNQEVRIKSKTFTATASKPNDEPSLRGRVKSIGRTVATPGLEPLDPYTPKDRHVIEVRIEIHKDDVAEAARFINLQVEAEFIAPAATAP